MTTTGTTATAKQLDYGHVAAKKAGFDSLASAAKAAGHTSRNGNAPRPSDLSQAALSDVLDQLEAGLVPVETPTVVRPEVADDGYTVGAPNADRAIKMLGRHVTVRTFNGARQLVDHAGTVEAITLGADRTPALRIDDQTYRLADVRSYQIRAY